MLHLTDLLGAPIQAGDTVSYISTKKNKVAMNVGAVEDVRMHHGSVTVIVEPHIASNGDVPNHRVYLRNTDRIVRL